MSSGRIELFQGMLAADPSNTTVRYGLANELFKAARFEEAIEEYARYLREADDQGAGYGKLAQALEHCQRTEEAREAYQSGIEAATRHGHPGMAQDFRQSLDDLA
jgi:predicted Zn-dependent protease